MRDEARLERLLDQLRAADDADCEAIAIALGEMGEAALPGLLASLADGDVDARFWAVRALWAMGTPAAVNALVGALGDPGDMVRSGAALALGELKAQVALERLAWLLRDAEGSAGDHAADALSKIGEPAVRFLVEALSEPRPWVRVRAARALVPIQSPDAIPALFRALDDDSYLVRYYAEDALARMGVGQMVYFFP
jgi:HEAT repeat protein